MSLANKVAIVTGASREIGAAMAEALASQGCAVLLAHYGEPERAQATVERIRAAGGRAERYEADLAGVAANGALVARAVELFGRLDILAANAGLTIAAPLLETDEATYDTLFDLNVKGSFFGAQAAARQMVAQGSGGRIVFSSSVTGVQAIPSLGAYGITKAALRHMARVWAVELGRHGITVNALGIGATLNERNLHNDPDYAAHWGALAPIGRVCYPEDAANALLFLVSDAAATVTGHTLIIDGGWTMTSPLP
ncbi:MAG TPA: SDR family oxidoreductase [Roseiflexaceae bacterium]|nr:SDR family oxidoreductase [Roseiflexaceae bacterium]